MKTIERAARRGRVVASAVAIGCAALFALAVSHGCGGGSGGSQSPQQALTAAKNKRLSDILQWVGEGVAIPGYDAMSASFTRLAASSTAFCIDRSAARLADVRSAWRDAIGAWLEVSVIDFGPIKNANYELRIEFWPDANNNVARSVEQLLARTEPITEEFLANQSVAAQGLSAIEALAFDVDGDALARFQDGALGDRRCDLLVAASSNLRTIGGELAHAWHPDGENWLDQLVLAGRGSTAFASRDAAIEEVVNDLVAAVEVTKNSRVTSPFGDSAAQAVPTRAESYRSGNSLANIGHVLAGVRRVFQGEVSAGYAFDNYLREIDDRELTRQLLTAADDSQTLVENLPAPLTDAIRDDSQRPQVQKLIDALTVLTRLIKNDLASEMQVTIGFNDNDGD